MHKLMFENRKEAGIMLAEKLKKYSGHNAVVLAIPRGGIPIGYEIAKSLSLPLDIILSKKIGHPQNPEFAIGSVSLEDVLVDQYMDVTDEYIKYETEKIRKDLKEKYKFYSDVRTAVEIKDKTVIVTDDGIATGNTLLVTIGLLRKAGAKKIVVAVPVLPLERVEGVNEIADDFAYVLAPKFFPGVGMFYEDFTQVSDIEAKKMLKEINKPVNSK